MSSSTFRTGAMSSLYASVGLYLYSIDLGVASANLNFSANLMGILTQFATLVCNARNLHELLHFRRLWVSGAGKGCQLNFR